MNPNLLNEVKDQNDIILKPCINFKQEVFGLNISSDEEEGEAELDLGSEEDEAGS